VENDSLITLNIALNLSAILLVILGTYLLSKQLFIDIVLNKFMRTQLEYKKYQDLPAFFKIAGFVYGVKPNNWFNVGTYCGDNEIEKKLKDITAPFRGFLYIVLASILQIISVTIKTNP